MAEGRIDDPAVSDCPHGHPLRVRQESSAGRRFRETPFPGYHQMGGDSVPELRISGDHCNGQAASHRFAVIVRQPTAYGMAVWHPRSERRVIIGMAFPQ